REREPEHVDRHVGGRRAEPGEGAHARAASVARDRQRGAKLAALAVLLVDHPAHRAALLDQRLHVGAGDEAGVLVAPELVGEHRQEGGLLEEEHEREARPQRTEVGETEGSARVYGGEVGRLRVREREDALGEADLVQQIERSGVERVAAEAAVEVGVFFEDGDRHAAPGEQEGEHHPGRPAADDHARRLARRRRARLLPGAGHPAIACWMPVRSICTEIVMSTIPISRSMATSPRSPINRLIALPKKRIALEAAHARSTARSHSGQRPGSWLISSSTVASADGPATYGTASGTMNGSPSMDSRSGRSGEGKIIRSAIRKRITPPAIESAGSVIWSATRT